MSTHYALKTLLILLFGYIMVEGTVLAMSDPISAIMIFMMLALLIHTVSLSLSK